MTDLRSSSDALLGFTLLDVAVGLEGTLLISPLLSSFFFGLSPTDAGTYLAVPSNVRP